MSCHGNGPAPTSLRPSTATGSALRVLLVGGPNVGKSTLFNALTGARQHTTNAPGTTVELATGTWRTVTSEAVGPAGDSAAVVVHDVAYLLGGESSTNEPVASVATLRLG